MIKADKRCILFIFITIIMYPNKVAPIRHINPKNDSSSVIGIYYYWVF